MNKIEVVPYETIHAYDVLDRNVRQGGFQLSQQERDALANGWKNGGPAYTLIVDEVIVGCAGVVLMGSARGEAWALLSGSFYKYKKASYKAIRDGLNAIIKKEKLIRIQSMVFGGEREKVCGHFLEHLGFHNETPEGMQAFGPHGENIHMYSKINKE